MSSEAKIVLELRFPQLERVAQAVELLAGVQTTPATEQVEEQAPEELPGDDFLVDK